MRDFSFDIRLHFDSRTEAAAAAEVQDFSLEAAYELQGVCGLMGPSGAGKTSLLRALAGLPVPAGEPLQKKQAPIQRMQVTVGGQRLDGLATERRRIGMVFQEARLFPHLTVRGNLQFAASRSAGTSQDELQTIAEKTGIGVLMDRQVTGLSGGERQRVALARALAYKPDLLLLDEPVSALDRQGRAQILAYLKSHLKQTDTAALVVLHDLYDASQIAEQILYMEQGRILTQDTPSALSTRLNASLTEPSHSIAILQARVLDFDADQKLLKLTFGNSYLQIAGEAGVVGAEVQLFVAARDVGVSLKPVAGGFSFHCIPARLDEVLQQKPQSVLMRLKLEDGQYLLAHISHYHFMQLQLKPNIQLHALIQYASLAN